jgi:hypothetical protein
MQATNERRAKSAWMKTFLNSPSLLFAFLFSKSLPCFQYAMSEFESLNLMFSRSKLDFVDVFVIAKKDTPQLTPYSFVDKYQHFGRTYFHHL